MMNPKLSLNGVNKINTFSQKIIKLLSTPSPFFLSEIRQRCALWAQDKPQFFSLRPKVRSHLFHRSIFRSRGNRPCATDGNLRNAHAIWHADG